MNKIKKRSLPERVQGFIKIRFLNPRLVKDKPKYFCIGRNKTGTTTVEKVFRDLGFIVGNQRLAERLQRHYLKGNFEQIIKYCKSAEVFQDYPFSHPETFKYLDQAYPGSKFILTVRDTPEQWYQSLVRFHSVKFGNGKIPTMFDLVNAKYVSKGWILRNHIKLYEPNLEDLYNKEKLIKHYMDYNHTIMEYFKDRHDDFIVINVACKDDYARLMRFIGIESNQSDFPWENRTAGNDSREVGS